VTIGVFARVFPDPDPRVVAAAIADCGFDTTQLNLVALGRPTLDGLDAASARDIARAFLDRGVGIWALSGTFNAIHPDLGRRRRELDACRTLIGRAGDVGTDVVTLCTGTRDADSMWRDHPDNGTRSAWRDLRQSLDVLLEAASSAGVRLGVEPEPANVVRDALTARRLLAELGDDARHVVIVLDPAGLLSMSTVSDQQRIVGEAFDLLGPWIGALHAKDITADGYGAAGSGLLDYGLVSRLYRGLERRVPVIAQDLARDQGPGVSAFLRAVFAG
jgi:sugar phosphate isomerase/epimerase